MFSKTAQKNKAMTYLVRDKAVALFFYSKCYHIYFKYICIHIYVISFLKIRYKENIKMYLIKFIYKEIEKSI